MYLYSMINIVCAIESIGRKVRVYVSNKVLLRELVWLPLSYQLIYYSPCCPAVYIHTGAG